MDDGRFMRAPLLIWKFLFADLVRIGALTAGGLVVVIAFAVSIKFMADGRVDLAGGIRLMALAVIPMLQYALPFAGGFAATLAYHRLASDNEATAAMSSGVGHRSLLAPALGLGVALGVGLLILANVTIPRFLRDMEETVTRDLTGVFVRTIERGESVRLGDWIVHAERVVRAGPDPSVGALDRLRLVNVLAVQLDSGGKAQGSVGAAEVDVWLFDEESSEEPASVAQFVFRGYSAEGTADSFRGEQGASQRIRIPSAFVDDPKFFTYSELRELRERPERINKIDSLRRRLALRLDQARLLTDVRDRLVSEGRVVLDRGAGERVIVYASGIAPEGDRWTLIPPVASTPRAGATPRPIRIDNELESGSVYVHNAQSAYLTLETPGEEGAALNSRAGLRLTALNVATTDEQLRTAPTIRERVILTNLAPLLPDAQSALALSVRDLQKLAVEKQGQADAVNMRAPIFDAYRRLRDRVDSMQREITSKENERAAYSVASIATMLCGSIVALRRQYSLPLPVFLWSFFPALGAVITISAGGNLTHKAGPGGLVLLWGGVACLIGYTILEYTRYRRH